MSISWLEVLGSQFLLRGHMTHTEAQGWSVVVREGLGHAPEDETDPHPVLEELDEPREVARLGFVVRLVELYLPQPIPVIVVVTDESTGDVRGEQFGQSSPLLLL